MQPGVKPSAHIKNWANYQGALRAFEKVAAQLRAAHVSVVPVKGIVLARWIYDDVGERPLSDVDLLVSRKAWPEARRALLTLGDAFYDSLELGELAVSVDGFAVELHAEMGRLELTDICVDEVIARCTVDTETFGFPVLRLDEVDHLLLVAINAVKDGFILAQPHIAVDLERFLARGEPAELVRRARAAGFATGLYCTAEWMAEDHGSVRWRELMARLESPRRRWYLRAMRAVRRSKRPIEALVFTLGFLSNDRLGPRLRVAARLVRRNAVKLMGRTPP